jgi:uncharacterized surface protein with fasciclin (FAS1) repeats
VFAPPDEAFNAIPLDPTLAGIDLEVTKEGDTIFVNGVEVVAADIEASNGVIHLVGGVLLPPTEA